MRRELVRYVNRLNQTPTSDRGRVKLEDENSRQEPETEIDTFPCPNVSGGMIGSIMVFDRG